MKRLLVTTMCVMGLSVVSAAQTETGQAAAAQASEKATVYVYRYKQFMGAALNPSVYCDEQELARMDNGRYFAVKVDAGKHSFRSNDKQANIEIDTKAGQKYFIRVEIASGLMKGHGRVVIMAPEQGEPEIKRLKPLESSDVRDRERVALPTF
jgi:hypothetical protein